MVPNDGLDMPLLAAPIDYDANFVTDDIAYQSHSYNSGLTSNSSNSGGASQYDSAELLHSSKDSSSICKSYFYGQVSTVIKSAILWSMMGMLVTKFTHSYEGLSITRCSFNLTLILGSFVANLIAEVVNIRKLLYITTSIRLLIWAILVPAFWVISSIYLKYEKTFLTAFIVLMAIDGFQVAFSNTVDLDYEGIDRVANQYDIVIPESLHLHMDNMYQMFFDFSFAFFAVPGSILMYYIKKWSNFMDSIVFVSVFAVIFFILSAISISCYIFGMPVVKSPQYLAYSQSLNLSLYTILREMCDKIRDNKDGMRIIFFQRPLMKSVLFFSVETAFENSMFLLIIPRIAMTSNWFSVKDATVVNLFSVCLIAMGKIGGSLYGIYVTCRVQYDPNYSHLYRSSRRTVRKCLVWGSLSLFLLPASLVVKNAQPSDNWISLGILCLGVFLFFAFSAVPKITFSSQLQSSIANHPLSHKLFDFVSTFITFVDAIVLLLLNFISTQPGGDYTVEKISLYGALFYAFYVVIQLFTELRRPSDLSRNRHGLTTN